LEGGGLDGHDFLSIWRHPSACHGQKFWIVLRSKFWPWPWPNPNFQWWNSICKFLLRNHM